MSNDMQVPNGSNHEPVDLILPETSDSIIPVSTPPKTIRKSKSKEDIPAQRVHPDELDNRELLRILSEVKNGNFAVRMPVDQVGVNEKYAIL